ncbi:hemocytin-like [Arctopsyche grandis]|uniref:hemocytin-like n=1 Tax=Arctopsyche grandis TaxID=121162 RepID=UPI00406D83E5
MTTFTVFLKCVYIFAFIGYIQGTAIQHPDNNDENRCMKKNEEWDWCKCEKTCLDQNPVCPDWCQPGCACKHPYLRDTWTGQCVLSSQCSNDDNRCWKKNEVWDWCKCEKTCLDQNPVCPQWCQPGCACKHPYLRDPWTGECVNRSQCYNSIPVCPRNEVYTECGTNCPLTCDNMHNAPLACNRGCFVGCECKKGYVRDTRSNRCVHPSQCYYRW